MSNSGATKNTPGIGGSSSIALFGAVSKGNGSTESDLWFRVPRANFAKHTNADIARLILAKHASFHLPRIPRPILKYIVQWINADGKEPSGKDTEKYPRDDITSLIFLSEASRELGVTGLIERTNADIMRIDSCLKKGNRKPTLAAGPTTARQSQEERGGREGMPSTASASVALAKVNAKPITTCGPYIAPFPPGPGAIRPFYNWINFPFEILAEDKDGLWLIHTNHGRLRPFSGEPNFQGEANAIGMVGRPFRNMLLGMQSFPIIIVTKWKGQEWKVVVNSESMGVYYEKEKSPEIAGHMYSIGFLDEA